MCQGGYPGEGVRRGGLVHGAQRLRAKRLRANELPRGVRKRDPGSSTGRARVKSANANYSGEFGAPSVLRRLGFQWWLGWPRMVRRSGSTAKLRWTTGQKIVEEACNGFPGDWASGRGAETETEGESETEAETEDEGPPPGAESSLS